MFEFCTNPDSLDSLRWFVCYLTTTKHAAFYTSIFTVFALIGLAAPTALVFGFYGAFAARSHVRIFRWFGKSYTSVVRGVPDIVFFLFVPIALDQLIEFIRYKIICPNTGQPVWQGNDFIVCAAAKMPLSSAAPWVHDIYGFMLAVIAFAVVLGAFSANVLGGALQSVATGQIEAGHALGLSPRQIRWKIEVPQMWIYALPGLSNLWQLLIKATPLLFLLGIEDVVYWARELGGAKTQIYAYPHGDWRIWYFSILLGFYLLLTWASQQGFSWLQFRLSRGNEYTEAGK